MKNPGWKKHFGFFSRLLLSFLLNLTIILAGLFIFHKFWLSNSFSDEIQKQNFELVVQIQRRLENDMAAMRRIAYSISSNSAFVPFNLADDTTRAIQTIEILQNYTLILPDSLLIGIIYDRYNYALTNQGSYKKENLFHRSDLTYEKLTSENVLMQNFIVLDDTILFVYPYRSRFYSQREGIVFIQYPLKSLIYKFTRSFTANIRFLTIKSAITGNILLTNNSLPDTEVKKEAFTSGSTGLIYEIATPLSYYRTLINRFQIQSLLLVTGLFILGIILSFLLARYNAGPLWKLIGKYGFPVSKADFSTIEKMLEEQQVKQEQSAYDAALNELMEGKINGADAALVNRIKSYIDINYTDKLISLDSIAESLGFSVGHLSRMFKKNTGITMAAYIQGLRIREACRLLRSTDFSVKEIIAKIGYMDHSNFTRSFKIQTGLTPQEYRLSLKPDRA